MRDKQQLLRGWLGRLRQLLSIAAESQRVRAVELTAVELRELENLFALLVLGAFIGMPAPPASVAAELLPHLHRELEVLNARARDASDALAELCGLFEGL